MKVEYPYLGSCGAYMYPGATCFGYFTLYTVDHNAAYNVTSTESMRRIAREMLAGADKIDAEAAAATAATAAKEASADESDVLHLAGCSCGGDDCPENPLRAS